MAECVFGRQDHKEKLQLLESLPMFEFCSEHQKDTLVEALEHRQFRQGDFVLKRGGSMGETVTVIKTGEVAVRGDNDVMGTSSRSPSSSPKARFLGIGEHRRLHRGAFIGRMLRCEEGAAVRDRWILTSSRSRQYRTLG
jgi:hypothetical protein